MENVSYSCACIERYNVQHSYKKHKSDSESHYQQLQTAEKKLQDQLHAFDKQNTELRADVRHAKADRARRVEEEKEKQRTARINRISRVPSSFDRNNNSRMNDTEDDLNWNDMDNSAAVSMKRPTMTAAQIRAAQCHQPSSLNRPSYYSRNYASGNTARSRGSRYKNNNNYPAASNTSKHTNKSVGVRHNPSYQHADSMIDEGEEELDVAPLV